MLCLKPAFTTAGLLPLLQPTIKDVIGADKEKEYMDSLETMGG